MPDRMEAFEEGVGRTVIGEGVPFSSSKYGIDAKDEPLERIDWPHGGQILVAELLGAVPRASEINSMNIVPWIALLECVKQATP
jgi:hypothetical protein